MRNQFAHRLHGLSFATPAIADRSQGLQLIEEAVPRTTPGFFDPPRRRYLSTFALLAYFFEQREEHVHEERRFPLDDIGLFFLDDILEGGRWFQSGPVGTE